MPAADYSDLEDQYLDACQEIEELKKRTTTERYLLFGGPQSIPALGLEIAPAGGWNDYRGSYFHVAEALKAVTPGEWYQVVDLSNGEIVASK